MIVGHLGVAAAVSRWRPRASLLWLLAAAVAPDILDFAYAFVGICNPLGLYSHTVPAALLLALGVAGAAALVGQRETAVPALLLVLLHLPFDWPTGYKRYWPGGELHGLALYDRPRVDFVMESVILLAGWALLRGSPTAPRWARSAWSFVLLVALLGGVEVVGRSLKPTACVAALPAAEPPASGDAGVRRAS